jgi:hypothetical protein
MSHVQNWIVGHQRQPVISKAFRVSLFVLASLRSVACGRVERGHQVRAQGDLQYVVAAIEGFREEHGSPPNRAELADRIGNEQLVDVWGWPIQYSAYSRSHADHYVLASSGRDGKLDVDALENYLNAKPEDVAGQYDRDIVVVDGQFVRNAGK